MHICLRTDRFSCRCQIDRFTKKTRRTGEQVREKKVLFAFLIVCAIWFIALMKWLLNTAWKITSVLLLLLNISLSLLIVLCFRWDVKYFFASLISKPNVNSDAKKNHIAFLLYHPNRNAIWTMCHSDISIRTG